MEPTTEPLSVGLDTGRRPFIGTCDMCELTRPLTHAVLRNSTDPTYPATLITLLCSTCGIGGA